MTQWQLAQLNIGLPVAPLDTEQLLWWLPTGVRPTVTDAEQRLAHLAAHGPTSYAFTFARPFASTGAATTADETWECGV